MKIKRILHPSSEYETNLNILALSSPGLNRAHKSQGRQMKCLSSCLSGKRLRVSLLDVFKYSHTMRKA